jgi:hypothetical protein
MSSPLMMVVKMALMMPRQEFNLKRGGGEVTFVFRTMAHKVETSFEESDLNHGYRDNHHVLKSLRADKHGSLPPVYIAWQLPSCRTSRFRAPTTAQPGFPYVIALTGMSQLLADSGYARIVWFNLLISANYIHSLHGDFGVQWPIQLLEARSVPQQSEVVVPRRTADLLPVDGWVSRSLQVSSRYKSITQYAD